jgi:copper transport protein
VLAAVTTAAPAGAHADLVGTDPADSARLPAAPARVTLTFSEDVDLHPGYLHVIDVRGHRVDAGPAVHPGGDGTRVTVPLRAGLPAGSYLVSYGVVSDDSHPVSGGYGFVVGAGPLVTASGAISAGSGTDPVLGAAFALARWASFAGLALLGGLVFVTVFWPAGRTQPRTRILLRLGWTVGAVSSVAGLLLQGPYAAGAGPGSILSPSLLAATVSTAFGRILLLRLAAFGVLGVVCTRVTGDRDRPDRARIRDENVAMVAGLALVASFSGAGHAAAGIQTTVAMVTDMAHLTAMSIWLGGLVMLAGCLLPTGTADQLAAVLPRFSRAAFAAVTVLVITGLYQAWRNVGSIAAVWGTGYGRLLAVKVAAAAVLVGLGNLSRRAVHRRYGVPALAAAAARPTPAAADEPILGEPTLRELRVSIGLEILIAAVVLALTAVLVATAPGRIGG